MQPKESNEIILTGISGAPGICIGKAYLVDQEGVDVVAKYYLKKESIKSEVNRFKAAVQKAEKELTRIIKETPEEFKPHAYIIETHIALLKDKMLYGRTLDIIEDEGVNAEWALKKVVSTVKPMFESMSDSYLKERSEDITQVSDRIMKSLTGVERINIGEINKKVILVAVDLSPAETSQIQLERIKGFITDRGGMASHTGIIARTLNIPAVMGLEQATSVIRHDDIIIVDGTTGTVIVNPSEQTLFKTEERKERYEAYRTNIAQKSHLPAETIDHFHLKMMGNIEFPKEVASILDYGGDGIGLYRTEFQYMRRLSFPTEEQLYEKYKEVVEVMADKPVTIRTLDINGDKAVRYIFDEEETNPALGLRAIRYCLRKTDVFKTQLRAILRSAQHGNVRIIFPMISNVEEVIEAKRLLNEAAESLYKENIPFKADIPVGIMIEVPSAVITADLIAQEVDFFSIGTNDLIQYIMAIDRDNRHLAHLYHPMHPAVIRILKNICEISHQAGISTYMCGEMAGDPNCLPILIGLGLNELSMNPQSIPVIKSIVRTLKAEDTKIFLDEVLKQSTATQIIELTQRTYNGILADTLYTE
jgi:phosphoenolpyruvate-protein phosphotransferase (PTS system enzyme I)